MLKIQNLKKKIKHRVILNDLTFHVAPGELIHIIGINGSGKSTLFKIICNISEADGGSVKLGKNVVLGALIENPAFMESSSGKANLKFLASINHHYNEKKISDLFTRFDLDFNDSTKIKNYSLGMRQKVGIIQAIMEDQNLILLDEPTRGLDTEALVAFNKIVEELVSQNKTVIIASHDNLSELNFTRKLSLVEGHLESI